MVSSPNPNLRDVIRCIESGVSSFPIKQIYDTNYVTENSINCFMEENDIKNIDIVLSTICDTHNIKEVYIVDDDNEFSTLTELCSLIESLDANEIMSVASGSQLRQMRLDKISAFILRREYDDIGEIDRYIAQCDRLLKDIQDERKIADDKKRNSSYKFSSRFFLIVIRSIFSTFILPMFVKKQIVLPKSIADMYANTMAKLSKSDGGTKTKEPEKTKTGMPVLKPNIPGPYLKGFKYGNALARTIIPNTANLYLSFKDYNKLLDHYEVEIKKIRNGLILKRKGVLAKKSENK